MRGTYDVVLDNFGPNEILGSVHIEVPDDMCARDIHALTRQISEGLTEKFGILATVGIYAANTTGAFAPLHADLDALAKSDRRSCRCTASTWTRKPRPSTSIWS